MELKKNGKLRNATNWQTDMLGQHLYQVGLQQQVGLEQEPRFDLRNHIIYLPRTSQYKEPEFSIENYWNERFEEETGTKLPEHLR